MHMTSIMYSILLQNFDTNEVIFGPDSPAKFWLSSIHGQTDPSGLERALRELCEGWSGFDARAFQEDAAWVDHLSKYLDNLVSQRLDHVQEWIRSNTSRFTGSHEAVENLRRQFEMESVEMKRNVQLCKTKCSNCHLYCTRAKFHEDPHDCTTDHACFRPCQFVEEHSWISEPCCLPCVCHFLRFIPTVGLWIAS